MSHNIILEIPMNCLTDIAGDLVEVANQKKVIVRPSMLDCIETHLFRSGIKSWLAQNVQGGFVICVMEGAEKKMHYDTGEAHYSKPWWKPHAATGGYYNSPISCPFSESVPILLRFEDSGDAIFFKMTYIENS